MRALLGVVFGGWSMETMLASPLRNELCSQSGNVLIRNKRHATQCRSVDL